jgi:hypothetical protein
MPRRSQGKLRSLCLVLLAAGASGCGQDETPPVPKEPLPFWALCENWRRRDGSCDQTTLLADYQDCLRTEGLPTKQRLVDHQVRSTRVSRAWQRATIVCLENRHWMMKQAGLQQLPGRETPPPS